MASDHPEWLGNFQARTNECQHGQLKRQCEICERDAEIERWKAEVARLKLEISRVRRDLIASEAPFYKAMKRLGELDK